MASLTFACSFVWGLGVGVQLGNARNWWVGGSDRLARPVITAACSNDSVGLPCDPAGSAGAKLECEGRCSVAGSGLVICQAVARVPSTGSSAGPRTPQGTNACKRYDLGGNANQLHRWAAKKDNEAVAKRNDKGETLEDENRRLRKETERLFATQKEVVPMTKTLMLM